MRGILVGPEYTRGMDGLAGLAGTCSGCIGCTAAPLVMGDMAVGGSRTWETVDLNESSDLMDTGLLGLADGWPESCNDAALRSAVSVVGSNSDIASSTNTLFFNRNTVDLDSNGE